MRSRCRAWSRWCSRGRCRRRPAGLILGRVAHDVPERAGGFLGGLGDGGGDRVAVTLAATVDSDTPSWEVSVSVSVSVAGSVVGGAVEGWFGSSFAATVDFETSSWEVSVSVAGSAVGGAVEGWFGSSFAATVDFGAVEAGTVAGWAVGVAVVVGCGSAPVAPSGSCAATTAVVPDGAAEPGGEPSPFPQAARIAASMATRTSGTGSGLFESIPGIGPPDVVLFAERTATASPPTS